MLTLRIIARFCLTPIVAGAIWLSSTPAAEGQITESEAKHQKTLKDFSPIEVAPKFDKGRWCGWISDEPGTLFDNSEYKLVQSFVIFGNPHWQYAHVSGTDANGDTFSGGESELRRFTLGMRIHFFQYFTATISSDMEDDGESKNENDYDSLDYALYSSDVIFDAQDAFNWECYDQFQLRMGYFKVPSNAGWATSSNSMRGIERASISNYSSPSDSIGMMISTRRNRWDMDLGVFSSDDINNGFSSGHGGFLLGHIGYMFGNWRQIDSVRSDLRVLVNTDASKGETFRQDWVVSASTVMRKQHWRLMADVIVGDNGSYDDPTQRGRFWGVNVMPSLWLVEDQLEAVFRYQYAEAEKMNGFRISAHSVRRIADDVGADVNDGYGDQYHSAYAGINYYICGDHTKIMAGVQWDELKSNDRPIYDGFTTWVAVRLYF